MLNADLVIAQTRKQQLHLPDLSGKPGEAVRYWAEQIIEAARNCIGMPRQEFSALVQVMGETQQARKLTRGLAKILEDACGFEQADPEQAAELRGQLFLRASEARRQVTPDSPWDRVELMQRVARDNGWDAALLDERLYADLPGAQRLLTVPSWTAQQLFERYDASRVQAVLLRAVRVRVRYESISVLGLRELLRQVKFRQLLHRSERTGSSGLLLTIDGPMTLFESATKYGLQLALLLPSLCAAGSYELEADVHWGKRRTALQFAYKYKAAERAPALAGIRAEAAPATDEVAELLADLQRLPGPFVAQLSAVLIDLPGVGLCVPDITFSSSDQPERRVHFELLGYWSRDAVWRRVELAEAGLPEPVIFGVNQRLRVSQEVLGRSTSAALHVFRGRVNPSSLVQCVSELARRRWSTT